jgi:DNA mismatch repair protein MutL
LSDHLANQIAAGEVIQRPSSAVKELLENAIDAGATDIQLIVRDAGKELIQVIDNGKGMSATDARMSFERHATSKIKDIEDLFTIRTMGFRGEALASIAAVTQVELKTRQHTADTGTRILIEGTEVKLQEACATAPGTSICLKNLFFNVPARRNFLKSNNTELRNIIDEFTRVALAYPQIGFRFVNNGTEQFHLSAGSLKARVMGLLGNTWEKKLVPVEENTDLLNISGFIGKPESAQRTRGMQFFFINNRFFKSGYLHHAVTKAYEGLIEKETFPFYVLFLDVDPRRVDVNVHPTKQEVKFEDDQMMYAFLGAAVKHALSRFNIAPSLDFTLSPEIQQLSSVQRPVTENLKNETEKGYLFNVFSQGNQAHVVERGDSLRQWKSLYEIAQTPFEEQPARQEAPLPQQQEMYAEPMPRAENNMLLIHGEYLATTVKSGLMLIHVRRAKERIWFERLEAQNSQQSASQQILFPVTYQLSPHDAVLLAEVLPELAAIGFDLSPFGSNTYVVRGLPPGVSTGEEKGIIDEVLDYLKHDATDATGRHRQQLIARMARRLARNVQDLAQQESQQALVDELFACSQPEYTPGGKKIFTLVKKDKLEDLLG